MRVFDKLDFCDILKGSDSESIDRRSSSLDLYFHKLSSTKILRLLYFLIQVNSLAIDSYLKTQFT